MILVLFFQLLGTNLQYSQKLGGNYGCCLFVVVVGIHIISVIDATVKLDYVVI